eukprot:CAMPEP_0171361990 /NCGR_PEP_ID=MMETSP0879-20121228/2349_1 /TAXON_ID=67004 /ORGANISM="Thalassiosira weissflogii, Strain CCMP1336" /LENGTH=294 /DNA_ID=CAMNT_0011868785 /DNA_START=20 /DNA_END=904 /DNA_ORIENTATION=+
MPKRPNSSRTPSTKEDSKRPRIEFEDDAATSSPTPALQAVSELVHSDRAVASQSVAAAAPSLPESVGKATARSSKAPFPSSVSRKSKVSAAPLNGFTGGDANGESGGKNSFLSAQRHAKDNKSSKPAVGKSEYVNPSREKSKQDDGSTTPNSRQTIDIPKEKPKSNIWAAVLTLFLLAVNIASAAYILAQETHHNISQMKCALEADNLKEELAKNRDLVAVLKSGMDETQRRIQFLEQANGAKVRAMEERRKESGDVATFEEEKRQWLEKIEKHQEDEKELKRKLRSAIGKFDL